MVEDDFESYEDIDLDDPLDDHELNESRQVWLLGVPPLDGGGTWYDLCVQRNGALANAPSWAAGPHGSAGLKFNGTNSNVAFANGAPFAATVFTFAAWVLPVSNAATWRTLVEHNRLSTAWWGIWQSGSAAGSYAWTIGAAGSGNTTTAGTITVGNPQRLVMTMDGSTSRGHINGTQVFSAARAPVAITTGSTRLGTNSGGSGEPYDGTMWDVCFWSRALSPAEVQADYDLSQRGYPGVLRRLRSPVSLLTGGTAYTLTADTGVFAQAGLQTALRVGRRTTGSPGTVAVSGLAAALKAGRRVSAAPGGFALTGSAAGLKAGRKVTAGVGTFSLAGQAATLLASRRLRTDTGAYAITGFPADLVSSGTTAGRVLAPRVGRGAGTKQIQGRQSEPFNLPGDSGVQS